MTQQHACFSMRYFSIIQRLVFKVMKFTRPQDDASSCVTSLQASSVSCEELLAILENNVSSVTSFVRTVVNDLISCERWFSHFFPKQIGIRLRNLSLKCTIINQSMLGSSWVLLGFGCCVRINSILSFFFLYLPQVRVKRQICCLTAPTVYKLG